MCKRFNLCLYFGQVTSINQTRADLIGQTVGSVMVSLLYEPYTRLCILLYFSMDKCYIPKTKARKTTLAHILQYQYFLVVRKYP